METIISSEEDDFKLGSSLPATSDCDDDLKNGVELMASKFQLGTSLDEGGGSSLVPRRRRRQRIRSDPGELNVTTSLFTGRASLPSGRKKFFRKAQSATFRMNGLEYLIGRFSFTVLSN